MNVLVTGDAGYIGSHTCVELIEAGHTPIVIDNLSNSNPESLHRVAEITSKTVEFIEGDVRDEALLEKSLQSMRFPAPSTSRASRRWVNPLPSRRSIIRTISMPP